jgi:hypothetical protein
VLTNSQHNDKISHRRINPYGVPYGFKFNEEGEHLSEANGNMQETKWYYLIIVTINGILESVIISCKADLVRGVPRY